MRTVMDEHDLRRWRRERNLTQARLAELLGITRRTLVNWETGRGIPLSLAERLEPVALALKAAADGAKPSIVPEFVYAGVARLRPDLRLYRRTSSQAHGMVNVVDVEHPKVLLGIEGRVAWDVLESPEYLAALDRHRGRAPLDENASPEEMAARGEAARLGALTAQEQLEHAYCKAHGIPWKHWRDNVSAEDKQRLMAFYITKK